MTNRIEDLRKNPFLRGEGEAERFAAYSGAIRGAYADGGELAGPVVRQIIDLAMAHEWEYPVPVRDMLSGTALRAVKSMLRTMQAENN